ncbi:MAG: methylated-DNA--[protein]-cysteine S-methyltransferase [Treponema sp.]|nr:methylated-DNA--[protein]-cysteine S-methyltransferase [Treponema sp.]
MPYTCTIETPLGPMQAAAEAEALTGLWFQGQTYYPLHTDTWIDKPDYPVFGLLRRWLAGYFTGQNPPPDITLAPPGSRFRQRVWKILREIPYGATCTYGSIAKQVSSPRAARAVGGAVGHNQISLLIPCHRVVGAADQLVGYAGGIERKRALLELEGNQSRTL